MSRILSGQFFNSNKSTLLDFLIRQTPSTLLPTQPVAEPVRGLCGQKFSVDVVCPTLKKFTFLKSSTKVVRNIRHPAKSDFLKWAPLMWLYYMCALATAMIFQRKYFHKRSSSSRAFNIKIYPGEDASGGLLHHKCICAIEKVLFFKKAMKLQCQKLVLVTFNECFEIFLQHLLGFPLQRNSFKR